MVNDAVIVAAGELLVEFLSHEQNCGLTRIANYSGPYPSGAPAIFSSQAALMGMKTHMIGGIGDDGFGRLLLQRLEHDGVETSGISITPNQSTGTAFVSYYDDGARDFIFHITNTAADNFNQPKGLFNPAQAYFHVSAASLGNQAMRETILALVAQVRGAGGKITCDPNARPELMRDAAARQALDDVMAKSYCLMPSTGDLAFLYPDDNDEAAVARMLACEAQIIVLKRGDKGACVFHKTASDKIEQFDFAPHNVTEIDPTGAGDCFCATFISLLAQGMSVFDAGLFANAAGAIAVTRRGPMEGNSNKQEIDKFLKNLEMNERSA